MTVITDVADPEYLSVAVGFNFFCIGISQLVAIPFGAILFDVFKSPLAPFIALGSLQGVFGTSFSLLSYYFYRKKKAKRKATNVVDEIDVKVSVEEI